MTATSSKSHILEKKNREKLNSENRQDEKRQKRRKVGWGLINIFLFQAPES